MKLVPDATLDINGFSFATECPCTLEALAARYPEAKREAYYDPESGYDAPYELSFSEPITREGFYVYARFGVARIGCLGGWNSENLSSFVNFCCNAAGN